MRCGLREPQRICCPATIEEDVFVDETASVQDLRAEARLRDIAIPALDPPSFRDEADPQSAAGFPRPPRLTGGTLRLWPPRGGSAVRARRYQRSGVAAFVSGGVARAIQAPGCT